MRCTLEEEFGSVGFLEFETVSGCGLRFASRSSLVSGSVLSDFLQFHFLLDESLALVLRGVLHPARSLSTLPLAGFVLRRTLVFVLMCIPGSRVNNV